MGIDPSYGLFRLGVEQGGNLRLWRMAVDLQAERIREAIALDRERHDDGRWRVDADAHLRRRLERPRRTPASAASEPSRLAVERRRGVGP